MRRISAFALCLISACTPMPRAEVTKSSASDSGAITALPALQAMPSGAPIATRRGNVEIVRDFLDLSFRMESGRALPVLTRFEGPITVRLMGEVPATAPNDLTKVISRFRSEAGLDVSPTTAADASITIEFVPSATLRRTVPSATCFVVPNVTSLAEYKAKRGTAAVDWANLQTRNRVAIFVPSDTSPQEVRDCLHEELAQAIGPRPRGLGPGTGGNYAGMLVQRAAHHCGIGQAWIGGQGVGQGQQRREYHQGSHGGQSFTRCCVSPASRSSALSPKRS